MVSSSVEKEGYERCFPTTLDTTLNSIQSPICIYTLLYVIYVSNNNWQCLPYHLTITTSSLIMNVVRSQTLFLLVAISKRICLSFVLALVDMGFQYHFFRRWYGDEKRLLLPLTSASFERLRHTFNERVFRDKGSFRIGLFLAGGC